MARSGSLLQGSLEDRAHVRTFIIHKRDIIDVRAQGRAHLNAGHRMCSLRRVRDFRAIEALFPYSELIIQ